MLNRSFIFLLLLGTIIPSFIKAVDRDAPLLTFQEKNLGGTTKGFHIKYIRKAYPNETIAFLRRYYPIDEPLYNRLVGDQRDGMLDIQSNAWTAVLPQGFSVCCYEDEAPNNLVGVAIFYECDDTNFLGFDVLTHYKVKKYLALLGVAVDNVYPTKPIWKKLMEAAKKVCDDYGFEVVTGLFTSQHANEVADELEFDSNKNLGFTDASRTVSKLVRSKKYPISTFKKVLKTITCSK